ncbi:MAG: hypothetical protein JW891_15875 [Candidatus Lokiarchaeota archaeon]|nr:hypothetical protein [Candidatus Lokiarchaeota archaeon]
MKMDKRIKQLKFIASIFQMSMKEFNNVMGPETIQTIFRLIGENQGSTTEKRIREKYDIKSWTVQELAEKLLSDVFEPALGENQALIDVKGNEMTIILKTCPFKKAGINIDNKFYCTYTEGLIETIANKAMNKVEFESQKLRAIDKCDCIFKITFQI